MTIKEAMKRIDFLERQIDGMLQFEVMNNYIVYADDEEYEVSDYNFPEVTIKIEQFQAEVLKLRKAINQANQKTLINIGDYTISDALVRMAQLNKNAERYLGLSQQKQKQREVTYNGQVEFTERLYDVNEAYNLYLATIEEIHELQTAIDKANILSEISIDN